MLESQSQSIPLKKSSLEELPKLSQDALDIIISSKLHREKTDLEILLLDKYNQYEEEIKLEKERKKQEELNRERIQAVKRQTNELLRLNIIKNIINRKKEKESEINEKLVEERNKLLQERREKIEQRKERFAESEKRRWEATRRAAEREREKSKKLGRPVTENPYSMKFDEEFSFEY